MELQGYVVVALTLILLGYLLPHLVRTRQQLLDSRVEDRFSGDLRILATAGTPDTAQGRVVHPRGHTSGARPYLHDPARRPEAPMNRPRARSERATEDARALAAARAARAARVSRRAAAARRRLVLTVALLLLSGGAWAAVGLAGASWALAVVPTLLLGAVLVLGRRTAVRAAAHDRRDRAEMARLEARLKAVSRRAQAAPPRRTTTGTDRRVASGDVTGQTGAEASAERDVEVTAERPGTSAVDGPGEDDLEAPVARVSSRAESVAGAADSAPVALPEGASNDSGEDDPEAPAARTQGVEVSAEEAPSAHRGDGDADGLADGTASTGTVEAADDRPWTPVPVPAPSYTLKQDAPRRDVAPYETVSGPTAAVPQRPSVASPAGAPVQVEEPVAPTLDLDAVLARRRAAGE
ncbi:hypothetical protein [Georgenia daeguensis]|uniref:Uncharacterized protein n=1 Tax=Georgenia daeguensis TaxID=908355 RepID=A0ABP6UIQ1_9MICO